jgi:hypothetical protein
MLDVLVATLIFGGVISYANYVGVRCQRIRTQILARADALSAVYQCSLPPRLSRWEPDFVAADAWSTRVVGVWWFVRATLGVASTLLMGGTLTWMASVLDHASFPILAICSMGPTALFCYYDLRKAKADLAATTL